MESRAPHRWRTAVAAVALVLGGFALACPDGMRGPLLHETLSDAAEQRIDGSLARNSVTFLTLSGLKAVLASIEGSSVGVGFHLELGDLVQPAYDYVDFVWRAFLYALALLGLYKLLMETGILTLGISLLGVGVVLWGAGTLGRGRLAPAVGWGRRIGVLGLAVAYALPLALLASQVLSQRYLEPLREQSATRIEEAGAPLDRAAERLHALRERLSILEPGRSLSEMQTETRALVRDVSETIWERTQAFLAYLLVLLVEILLLPFLSAWLIVKALGAASRAATQAEPAPRA